MILLETKAEVSFSGSREIGDSLFFVPCEPTQKGFPEKVVTAKFFLAIRRN